MNKKQILLLISQGETLQEDMIRSHKMQVKSEYHIEVIYKWLNECISLIHEKYPEMESMIVRNSEYRDTQGYLEPLLSSLLLILRTIQKRLN